MNVTQARRDDLILPKRTASPRRVQDYVTIACSCCRLLSFFSFFSFIPFFDPFITACSIGTAWGLPPILSGWIISRQILTDQVFMKAVGNCLLIVVFSLVIQLPLALVLAIMVGRDLPGRAFFRSIFFMPYVISEVITGHHLDQPVQP